MPNFKIGRHFNPIKNYHLKIVFSILAFVILSRSAFSQAPVITSFNPESGPAGSTVTINGSNFNAAAIVYFGAAKATVISQTNNQIKVTAPINANYQPITVTANGLTAFSARPFILTFTAAGPVNSQSFANKKDFLSGREVNGTVVKDLDGDGKTDIIAVNELDGYLSIFRNTSSGGALSFAPVIKYALQDDPLSVAVGDLDGDGKPDIIVNNYSSQTISVFLNTSSIGNISFAPLGTIPTLADPYDIVLADFDGDGRLDIAITYNTRTASPVVLLPIPISIFRNLTTSPGSVSFAPAIYIQANIGPFGLTTADIDGDGKTDIIAANGYITNDPTVLGESSLLILRNTSANGNISFAPILKLITPFGNPQNVAAGDLNGDGKLDIVVANVQAPGSISVFENNSTPGNVDFMPRQDIPTCDQPYCVAIGDLNGDGKPDIVVTDLAENSISVLVNSGNGSTITLNRYINFVSDLASFSVNIADENGDGVPDIILGNISNNTVSDNTVSVLLVDFSIKHSVITFPVIDAKTICDADFYVNATSSNTAIPIIYTSSNTAVATISAQGLIHIVGPGTTTITASQGGDANYDPPIPQSQILTVTAPVVPIVAISADHPSACSGAVVTFTALVSNLTANLSYQWQVNGVDAGTDNPIFTSSTLTDGDIVTCKVTNTGTTCSFPVTGLSNAITFHVVPAGNPSVTINASANNVYAGMPVTFTATPADAGSNPDYQWQVNGVNEGSNGPTFTSSTLKNGDQVTCILSNKTGCYLPVTSTPVIMNILPPIALHIPNAFTPNNDGINDLWNITGLSTYPNCMVSIYNRYGSLVYQSKGYGKAWDGLYQGKKVAAGVYYYIITIKDETQRFAGSLTILY